MMTLRVTQPARRRGEEHRARTLDSGVRALFGRRATPEQPSPVGLHADEYTITGAPDPKAGGARPVLGVVIAYHDHD